MEHGVGDCSVYLPDAHYIRSSAAVIIDYLFATQFSLHSEHFILASLRTYWITKLSGDRLLASAAFRRFWFSSALNGFGAQITTLALPLCAVLLLHATPEQMGMLVALQAVPFALFGLPVGVLLDRSSKLPIMLFSKSMSGIALASVAVAYRCSFSIAA